MKAVKPKAALWDKERAIPVIERELRRWDGIYSPNDMQAMAPRMAVNIARNLSRVLVTPDGETT